MNARTTRGIKLGLTTAAATALSALHTPQQIQDFITAIPMNFELGGGTALSVAEVLKQNRAHCIEGAFVAACALWIGGEPPLLMDMGADEGDDDHVIALFKRGGYWGAISKSNGTYLRFRDPMYRTLRELALSYFHEYTKGRRKTLRTYSTSVDLRRIDPKLWVTNTNFCEEIVDALTTARHFKLLPRGLEKHLRAVDIVEVLAHRVDEYAKLKKKQGHKR